MAGLPERDRAVVVAKLMTSHDELLRRAADAEARESADLGAAARNQATIAAAAQVLRAAGWTCEPPEAAVNITPTALAGRLHSAIATPSSD
jgi:hypothetical protein